MSAALLARAAAAGVSMWLDGTKVRWRARRPPPPELLADLRADREAVAAALAADEAARRRDAYEERAAIMEFDGAVPRSEAEARARADEAGRRASPPRRPP